VIASAALLILDVAELFPHTIQMQSLALAIKCELSKTQALINLIYAFDRKNINSFKPICIGIIRHSVTDKTISKFG
jgi:hypothetical protein